MQVVVHEGDPERVATLLPGRLYSPDFPVLYYARAVLLAGGWTVRETRWGDLPDDPAAWPGFVAGEVRGEVELAARSRLVVGKSLGTHALPVAAAAGVPGIWLTPLLGEPAIARSLLTGTAPAMVVGGTADPAWDAAVVESLRRAAVPGCEVVEIPAADHLLEVPGDPAGGAEILASLVRRMSAFLDQLG